MRAPPLAILVLLAACGSPPGKTAKEPSPAPLTEIRSARITLPDDTQTFGDPVLDAHCTACHSATMVLYQPPLNRKAWEGVVTKMREAYKAPIDQAQTDAIVDALMAKAPSRR